MNAWHLDIMRKRDGRLALYVLAARDDRFESEEISSTALSDVISAVDEIAHRLGRPAVIYTDGARIWSSLADLLGAYHRVPSPREPSRLSLLECRVRAEDRV